MNPYGSDILQYLFFMRFPLGDSVATKDKWYASFVHVLEMKNREMYSDAYSLEDLLYNLWIERKDMDEYVKNGLPLLRQRINNVSRMIFSLEGNSVLSILRNRNYTFESLDVLKRKYFRESIVNVLSGE